MATESREHSSAALLPVLQISALSHPSRLCKIVSIIIIRISPSAFFGGLAERVIIMGVRRVNMKFLLQNCVAVHYSFVIICTHLVQCRPTYAVSAINPSWYYFSFSATSENGSVPSAWLISAVWPFMTSFMTIETYLKIPGCQNQCLLFWYSWKVMFYFTSASFIISTFVSLLGLLAVFLNIFSIISFLMNFYHCFNLPAVSANRARCASTTLITDKVTQQMWIAKCLFRTCQSQRGCRHVVACS